MSDLRKAAQQALEALEYDGLLKKRQAITALRDALAQEQTNGSWHDGLLEGQLRERERWLAQQPEPVQEPLVWEPVVLDLPALTQREYDALHADLRWNYKKITPPKVEPKFLDTVLYTGSSGRVTTVSSVSVTTQHRVLTDADLDAIRKIVREGGKE